MQLHVHAKGAINKANGAFTQMIVNTETYILWCRCHPMYRSTPRMVSPLSTPLMIAAAKRIGPAWWDWFWTIEPVLVVMGDWQQMTCMHPMVYMVVVLYPDDLFVLITGCRDVNRSNKVYGSGPRNACKCTMWWHKYVSVFKWWYKKRTSSIRTTPFVSRPFSLSSYFITCCFRHTSFLMS